MPWRRTARRLLHGLFRAGKSTLAYTLMQQGWRLLADDMVAITPHGRVLPGIPRIKLWHDATKAFGLDPDTLPQIRQGIHKYLLMGDAIQHLKEAVPLAAMYIIPSRRNDDQDPEDWHHPDHQPESFVRTSAQPGISAAVCTRSGSGRPKHVPGSAENKRALRQTIVTYQYFSHAELACSARFADGCSGVGT